MFGTFISLYFVILLHFVSIIVIPAVTITYAIGLATDVSYLHRLMRQISHILEKGDMIIIQVDDEHVEKRSLQALEYYSENHNHSMQILHYSLNNDFSAFMNNMIDHSSRKGYMFRIDSDELLSEMLLLNLKWFLMENQDADAISIPRSNYFLDQGNGDRDGYPDFQMRLFKLSNHEIRYHNKVHETLGGYKKHIHMPAHLPGMSFELIHLKTRKKQHVSDKLYQHIESQSRSVGKDSKGHHDREKKNKEDKNNSQQQHSASNSSSIVS